MFEELQTGVEAIEARLAAKSGAKARNATPSKRRFPSHLERVEEIVTPRNISLRRGPRSGSLLRWGGGAPVPRQQFAEPRQRDVGDASENVGEAYSGPLAQAHRFAPCAERKAPSSFVQEVRDRLTPRNANTMPPDAAKLRRRRCAEVKNVICAIEYIGDRLWKARRVNPRRTIRHTCVKHSVLIVSIRARYCCACHAKKRDEEDNYSTHIKSSCVEHGGLTFATPLHRLCGFAPVWRIIWRAPAAFAVISATGGAQNR